MLAGALLATPAARAAAPLGPAQLKLISTHRSDPRLTELVFSTPALSAPTHVRILLPASYARHPHQRYPVLYLLHGSIDSFAGWTSEGDAERITAPYQAIVVMPDAGSEGYYSDWYNGGRYGPPAWETYHIAQLLPWIDARYRTTGRRAGRAIAGLSMGGFGAFSYAARHPDLFGAAASFSGAIDTNYPPFVALQESTPSQTGAAPGALWGEYSTDQVRWRARNPWDLAGNLHGMSLVIRTGNGKSGGPYPWNPGAGIFESGVEAMSIDMHAQLTGLRISHLFDDYGPGDHSWPYWQRDLRETMPLLMRAFAHPLPRPSPFSFTAVESRYAVYGWSVSIKRPALEFSTLSHATAKGFTMSGSGTATVRTAALYRARSRFEVTITDGSSITHAALRAGRDRRLIVRIALGPGNPYQEYTPAAAGHTVVYVAHVRILSVAGKRG